jgi:diacylglycerol kinase
MEERIDSKQEFSLLKRAQSFSHAGRGLLLFMKTTHNAWVHMFVFVCAVAAGVFFSISSFEWMFLVLASGFVFASEAVNTAIEIDIDLTSPEYHPYARDTKDVAASAVLIASVTAFLIGLFIFGPHVYALLV